MYNKRTKVNQETGIKGNRESRIIPVDKIS